MDELLALAERVARLEKWANAFSCSGGHENAPAFTTKAHDEEVERNRSALRARAHSKEE